jgi:hypothetical protein
MSRIIPALARQCPTVASVSTLPNATTFYQLVQAEGMAQTKVLVIGPDPPGITIPSQPPTQNRVWPWQRPLFFPF